MTLYEIYDLITFITNKDYEGESIGPDRYASLIKVANIDRFRQKYGLPEGYQPGRPIPPEHAEVSLKNIDDLKIFKTLLSSETVSTGLLAYPTDYAHRDEMWYNYTKTINAVSTVIPRRVEFLKESQAIARRESYTKQPTTWNPVAVLRNDGIYVYPATITSVDFSYYRWPIDPVFAYEEGDGYITYDADNSVELEWPQDEHLQIAMLILSYLGVNLRIPEIVQYSELKRRQG